MADETKLKPIGPYMIGQVVGYVDLQRRCVDMCEWAGNWFAVSTEPRHEELARGEISSAGLVTYLPLCGYTENHGRGRRRTVLRPMFVSYLFVKCEATDEHLSLVTRSRGVRHVIGMATEEEVKIVRLVEAEDAERAGPVLRARALGKSGLIWHFSPGDRVRIKNGPFAGFYAQLKSAVDPDDRIRALISIFDRPTRTDLSAHDIEAL